MSFSSPLNDFNSCSAESSVEKKMAAVTAIRCEPNTVDSATFVPAPVTLCKLGLKILEFLLYVFINVVRVFALQIMIKCTSRHLFPLED